jgi:hypothetical protein
MNTSDAAPELLPCPFCGAKNAGLHGEAKYKGRRGIGGNWGGFYVRCEDENCTCVLGMLGEEPELDHVFGEFATADEAAAAWNRRATL